MLPEDMIEELYEEMSTCGIPSMNNWEEDFITDIYVKVIENGQGLSSAQEDKVIQIHESYMS